MSLKKLKFLREKIFGKKKDKKDSNGYGDWRRAERTRDVQTMYITLVYQNIKVSPHSETIQKSSKTNVNDFRESIQAPR